VESFSIAVISSTSIIVNNFNANDVCRLKTVSDEHKPMMTQSVFPGGTNAQARL
jgi:hypothetical protein